ncbi:NAD(+) synthase [Pigmentibacter sp. JX0631]|uniref:NAD(+) synthase n=1 Tax=Pigmentibacter sp. JX0631 TaxID=2976982 RepID=UPI002469857E|nr:NAD(+) synthase [Pigmentibacter sp. JX0631]WGL59144.1 NAD(+) synthase [Pigmentibacter sp. JX0631]
MKIAIGQLIVKAANCAENFHKMQDQIIKAVENQAQLIIFPEMALPGYFIGDTWEQLSFLHECEFYHKKILNLSKDIDIIFGSVGIDWRKKNEDGRVRKYNSIYCASNGKFKINSKTKYPFWIKSLLPNYREFDDSRYFYDLRKLANDKNLLIQDLYEPLKLKQNGKIINIGISICEDAWSDDYHNKPILTFNKKYKHDFFLNLSASPFTLAKKEKREKLFCKIAKSCSTPLFYVNCVGAQNLGKTIYGFDGSSTFYSKKGEIIEIGNFFAESLRFFQYDLKKKIIESKKINQKEKLKIEKAEELQISLEYIIKNCLNEWNIKKVVIGLSGGIDSALSAVLFTRVLGNENVYLVNMPSKFNSNLTKNAAKKLADNLQCPFTFIPIDESINYTKEQLSKVVFSQSGETIIVNSFVFENIQARDRGGRILAAVAAALGGVFVCNANKSEMTVGYSTLYGDQAGFLAPIADLWKQDVYLLAHHYNNQVFKKQVIPLETLQVVPSAELSEKQNVMENKGDPLCYPYHDFLFASWVEHWNRKTPEDCLKAYLKNNLAQFLGCEKKLIDTLFPDVQIFIKDLERWWSLYRGMAAFKRVQAPPVVALTRRAFGNDHREHISRVTFSAEYEKTKSKVLKN